METITIVNPTTRRGITVSSWYIQPRAMLDELKRGTSLRDISLQLLSEPESIERVHEEDGDSAHNNWALNIFENALDWGLGLAAFSLIRDTIKAYKRLPKPFRVAASRSGDIFLLLPSGHVHHYQKATKR